MKIDYSAIVDDLEALPKFQKIKSRKSHNEAKNERLNERTRKKPRKSRSRYGNG